MLYVVHCTYPTKKKTVCTGRTNKQSARIVRINSMYVSCEQTICTDCTDKQYARIVRTHVINAYTVWTLYIYIYSAVLRLSAPLRTNVLVPPCAPVLSCAPTHTRTCAPTRTNPCAPLRAYFFV